MKRPEQYRLKTGAAGTDHSYGNNGVFYIPHFKILNYLFRVIASDEGGWQHCSVSLVKTVNKVTKAYKNIYGSTGNAGGVQQCRKTEEIFQDVDRCPNWEEMCFVKSMFWDDDTAVMQLHPPKEDWVNNHAYCLHLWKPDAQEIPLPPPVMVGIRENNVEENKTLQ